MNGGPTCPVCTDFDRCGGQCAWYVSPSPDFPQGGCVLMYIAAKLQVQIKVRTGGTPR